MSLFSKPIARIYIEEIRTRLDKTVVPIFSPDTAIDVGDFGAFEDGQFVRKGNVDTRGIALDIDETPASAFDFASAGKVQIGASVKVPNPLGGDLVKSTIGFGGSKAVVASFKRGVERVIGDADRFGEELLKLWYTGGLPVERVVVWGVRRAAGGTVMVSEEGDNEVEVFADAAALGPVGITLAGLSAGVTFGAERKATWKLTSSDAPLIAWARMLRLSDDQRRVVDAFRFDTDASAPPVAGMKPAGVTADDLLAELGAAGT